MPGWGSWALWGAASYQQGYDPLAKQDTLYLAIDGGGGISDLAIDRCQYLDNQTAGATWTSEAAPASRFNLTNRWCYEFDFDADNADTGRFFQYDCVTVTSDLSLQIIAGGIVRVIINNTVPATTLTLPGVSGSNQRFVLQWSAEPNPDTTGAADALRHFLCAWNLDTGAFDKVTFNTVVRPGQTGAMTIWAASSGGSSPFTGVPHAVRMGRKLHAPTETAIDFVETRTEPATDVDFSAEDEGMPVDTTTGVHGVGEFQGPAVVLAVDKTNRLIRRCLSPLYNKYFRRRVAWDDTDLDATDNPKIRAAPGDPGYRLFLGWLQVAAVPDTCTHLWVRVHVQSSSSSTAVPVGVRFYSFNRPPGGLALAAEGLPPEPLTSYYASEIITRDDAGVGEWCVEQLVPIARGTVGIRKNKTYLAIALQVDPEGSVANDADATVTVKGCHAVPCFVSEAGQPQFGALSG